MAGWLTLAAIAAANDWSHEALAAYIRRDDELRVLGTYVGHTRLYSPSEASTIVAAYANRRKPATV